MVGAVPRAAGAAPAPVPLRVLIPDAENLQYLAFWVALGAGYFRDESLAVRVVPAGAPGAATSEFLGGAADVAILPPPQYGQAMAQGQPLVAFGSLLQHEPANVIVRGDVASALGSGAFSPSVPVLERARRLRGLRIGVAPGPGTRLRALLAAAGLDADRDVQLVSIPGEEQNPAFGRREVDALFAHTPYLERALVQQGAVMAVHLSASEWAPLAGMEIHLLMTTRQYAAAQPGALTSLARGVLRAQQLIHADAALVDRVVALYAPAVPRSPDVSVEGVRRAVTAWGGGAAGAGVAASGAPATAPPAGPGGGGGGGGGGGAAVAQARPGSDVATIAFADYVAPRFAQEARAKPRVAQTELLGARLATAAPVAVLVAGALVMTLVLAATLGRRPLSPPNVYGAGK